MTDRVELAVQSALKQTLTIAEYEQFLQLLVSQAAVILCDYQGQQIASHYMKGVSQTLLCQAGGSE